jgi:hypothetical protein
MWMFDSILFELFKYEQLIYVGSGIKKLTLTPCRRKGERKYSSYSFLILALDGIYWLEPLPGRALQAGTRILLPIGWGAVWDSELFWTKQL